MNTYLTLKERERRAYVDGDIELAQAIGQILDSAGDHEDSVNSIEFDAGYERGYENGYDDGFEAGKDFGYEECFDKYHLGQERTA